MIEICSETEKDQVIVYLSERFGMASELFSSWEFYSGSKGRIILGPKDINPALRPDTAGLLIARIAKTVKPSSNLLQLFGTHVSRNAISLSRENTMRFVRGEDLSLSPEESATATEGYVLLRFAHYALGCGLLKDGRIKNMLPKAKRVGLKYW